MIGLLIVTWAPVAAVSRTSSGLSRAIQLSGASMTGRQLLHPGSSVRARTVAVVNTYSRKLPVFMACAPPLGKGLAGAFAVVQNICEAVVYL